MTARTSSDYSRAVLDAVPIPVFVVDQDVRLLDFNAAGARLVGADRKELLYRRGGELLHCIHSTGTDGRCGHGLACQDCVLRQSVNRAFQGNHVYQARADMELRHGSGKKHVHLLITASPFDAAETRQALLVVEDVTDIFLLQSLLPICASCKKIRDDTGYWNQVESYFNRHANLKFSHCLCPMCVPKYFPNATAEEE